jgi:hypothetical protein
MHRFLCRVGKDTNKKRPLSTAVFFYCGSALFIRTKTYVMARCTLYKVL